MDKCVICGKEFIPMFGRKTCSKECSQELKKLYNKKHYDSVVGDRTKKCVVCGKEFESRYGRITCSEECQKLREKEMDNKW